METTYKGPINYLSGKKALKFNVPARSNKLVSYGNTLLHIMLTILLGVKYDYIHMLLSLQYTPMIETGIKVAFVLNAMSIIREFGLLCGLKRSNRIADIPIGLVLLTAALGILTWVACVQDVPLPIARIAVFAIFTVLWLILSPSSTTVPKKVKVAQNMPPLVVEQKQPVCSVCQRASIYDVCMECERTHHREIQRVRSQNWRAKKADEPATLTIAEWLQALEFFHYHCAYCQTKPYECLEHYYPIGSRHKDGGTTAKNCVPACRKCNTDKSNKDPGEDD